MRTSSLLTILLFGFTARAMEFVNVSAGYNLRSGASKNSVRIRTLRKSVEATLLLTRGDWRRVCIGGVGTVCEGGLKAWVYKKGVTPARDEPPPEAKTKCVGGECARKPPQKIAGVVRPLVKAIDGEPRYSLPAEFGAACSARFMNSKGLGPWGRAMIDAANRVAPNCFYNRNFYGSICPNYKALPLAQKNAMIAMTFAAIARTESHCNPKAQNPDGSNDVADGMFQLEQTASFRAKQGRDPRWCRTQQRIDTQDMTFQAECSVSTIDRSICGRFGSFLFDSRGYWQELRHDREITRRIRKAARDMRLCVGGSSDDEDD